MKSFDPKARAEVVGRSAIFSKVANPGTTVSSCVVTATVDPSSAVADPTPSAILSGSPIINSLVALIGGITVLPGLAVTQTIQGGVVGCTYALTYTATMTDGQIFVEQVTQFVAPYVPFP